MNKPNYVRLIVTAILASATSGSATTADITGLNQWGQYGGLYGGTVTTVNVSTDQAASGNASLVFGVADGNGLSVPQAVFASPISGGTVTVTTKIFFPATSNGAFLLGFDDTGANYVQLSNYILSPTNGFGYAEAGNGPSTGGYTLVRDQWKELKLVVDLDHPGVTGNGTLYYDDMVTPAGTFTYGGGTIAELWILVGNSFNGTPVTGPFYFDDMVVEQDSTVIWSDNFDSYIPSAPSGYSAWATTYAGGQTPGEDYNNDGVQNGIAYFMGMNAMATNPGVVSGTVTWPNGGNIPSSAYGTQFVVQTSTDLVNWTDVLVGDPNLNNTSGSVSYTLPTGAPKEFCRFVVTP